MNAAPTVVLVHGLAIQNKAEKTFHGVAEAFHARGIRAVRPQAQGGGSLDELAERVWRQIEGIDGPLALLCHSMGGLQARTFLVDESRARRIVAVATVGSPHRGTPLASVLTPFGVSYRHLTPKTRREWQSRHADAEESNAARFGIRRLSAVASLAGPARTPRLRVPQLLLDRAAGPNDGLVPAASQRWGEHVFDTNLDHVECAAVRGDFRSNAAAVDLWLRLGEAALGRSLVAA